MGHEQWYVAVAPTDDFHSCKYSLRNVFDLIEIFDSLA